MDNVTQNEPEERVTVCFKANREFRIALDTVLAKKQITVQEFCYGAVSRAVSEAESEAAEPDTSAKKRRAS